MHMLTKRAKTFILFSVFILTDLVVGAVPVHAAEFRVVTDIETLNSGASFEARVVIDTDKKSINAFEGVVTFPRELLTPLEVREGGSMVNFWVERPRVATNGPLRFSGITPGGFTGQGRLFSIVFRATKSGSALISVADAKALENNGTGNSLPATTSGARVTISPRGASSKEIQPIDDTDPPEPFTPIIAHDPALFGDRYFLVFATQDKKSGIDHYEVCEGGVRQCHVAESPYLLHYQYLNRSIVVKAVDRVGNERTASLFAFMHLPWYQNLLLLAILGIVASLLIVLCRFLWRNYTRSR